MGMHSKVQTFSLQRKINTYLKEPLSAIMPGIALHELWGIMSVAEQALLAVSIFVVVAGLLGMLSSLLTSLQSRRREMAILRAVGAKPSHIFSLLISEAALISALGIVLGISLLFAALWAFAPYIRSQFGINIELSALSVYEWYLIGAVQVAGVCIGCIPAFSAYRMSLSDGMSIRV
jgi:putative ABC transport system permease protein